jgi:hypothetical protein
VSLFSPNAADLRISRIDHPHRRLEWLYKAQRADELVPRVHLVVGLLKRWLLGTHQGGHSIRHLNYYLDEFTFRFNRRRSGNRGQLFSRLLEQAVALPPTPYRSPVGGVLNPAQLEPE